MAVHTEASGSSGPSRFRVHFSLLALFIFVTIACLALAWVVQPERVVVTSLFHVNRSTPVIMGDETSRRADEADFETVKKTQLAFLNSYFVLQSALRSPGVASLPILAGKADPVDWLQKNLEVEFPHDAEILAIRLRGPKEHTADLVRIVDSVSKAYEEQVVFESHQRKLGTRDLMAASLKKLQDELSRKMQELHDINEETGGESKDSVDGRMRQMEIDILMEQWRKLSGELEHMDIEASAPRRIQKIQTAVPSPE